MRTASPTAFVVAAALLGLARADSVIIGPDPSFPLMAGVFVTFAFLLVIGGAVAAWLYDDVAKGAATTLILGATFLTAFVSLKYYTSTILTGSLIGLILLYILYAGFSAMLALQCPTKFDDVNLQQEDTE